MHPCITIIASTCYRQLPLLQLQSLIWISGDDLTSDGNSDEDKTLAADELESEWMSDSDSGGEEGMPVICVVSVVVRCSPQIQAYHMMDSILGALELPEWLERNLVIDACTCCLA